MSGFGKLPLRGCQMLYQLSYPGLRSGLDSNQRPSGYEVSEPYATHL
jgi:hypothetical protein